MTADQKRDAWLKLMTAFLVSSEDSAPEGCSTLADQALALMEQREREGRFGPPSDQGSFTLHAAKMGEDLQRWHDHAMKAEAEVGRLSSDAEAHRAEMAALRALHADNLDRANKAESLLKEALGHLRDAAVLYTPKSIGREDIDGLIARARQEGFEP